MGPLEPSGVTGAMRHAGVVIIAVQQTGSRRALAVALVTLVALFPTACGSASQESPPSGVDGLTITTPSPDPDDFVERVDNPLFPLAPGSVRTYDVTGGEATGGEVARTMSVSVGEDRVEIAGVATTEVRTEFFTDGVVTGEVADRYAQDRAGNVWWFGRAQAWEAGVDGAEAGLVMPATPRVGDGYRLGHLVGVVEDRAEVVSIDTTVDTTYDDYVHVVVTQDQSALAPGVVRRNYYAEGVGLVYSENVEGPEKQIDLSFVSAP